MRGTRLGNYEPLLELASGGMATVFVARHVGAAGFERLVVIKRVHPHLLKDREFHDMFRDEARVSSTIRHPNVVPVIDVIETPAELLLVLEYVEGMSLSTAAKTAAARGAPLAPAIVSRIVADALAGLHAAHEAVDLRGNKVELIHRDVSPQNILVGLDGTSRLIDFGIAKAASRISVTNSGVLKGKLRYMSPEQVQKKLLDRRADVFSAGVVLYEALTGKRPFAGDDEGDVVLALLIGEIDPPSSVVPSLPPAVDAVLAKALARDRGERYPTASALQEALEAALPPAPAREVHAALDSLGGDVFAAQREALRAAMEDDAAGAAASRATMTTEVDRAEPPRRRYTTVAIALGLSIVLGAGVFAIRGRRAEAGPEVVATSTAPVVPSAEPAPVASVDPAPSTSTSTSTSSARPGRKSEHPRTGTSSDLHRRNPYGAP